jgi:hypothetical protein
MDEHRWTQGAARGGATALRSCWRSLPRTTAEAPRPPNWRHQLRDAALSEAFLTNPEIVLATGLLKLFAGSRCRSPNIKDLYLNHHLSQEL